MDVTPWTVQREQLLPPLQILDLVPARLGIPSSQHIRMDWADGRLRLALASEVSGDVVIRGQGRWPFQKQPYFIDRRLFLPFVFAAKDIKTKSDFEFTSVEGDQLCVRQGRRKATFAPMTPVAGYGQVSAGAAVVLEFNASLFDAIRCAKECSTGDPSVPHLNCVYLRPRASRGVDVLATNQIVIQHGTPSGAVQLKEALPFPLYLVDLLGQEGVRKIVWRPREVCLEFAGGRIWQTVSAKAARGFPVQGVFKRLQEAGGVPEAFRVNCRQLGTVVSRLGVYLQAVRRQDWLLKLTGASGAGDLTLEAAVPQGVFRERLRLVKPLVAAVSMEWPLEMLLSVFDYLGKHEPGDLQVRYGEQSRTVTKDGKSKTVVARSPYYLLASRVRLVVSRLVKGSK